MTALRKLGSFLCIIEDFAFVIIFRTQLNCDASGIFPPSGTQSSPSADWTQPPIQGEMWEGRVLNQAPPPPVQTKKKYRCKALKKNLGKKKPKMTFSHTLFIGGGATKTDIFVSCQNQCFGPIFGTSLGDAFFDRVKKPPSKR